MKTKNVYLYAVFALAAMCLCTRGLLISNYRPSSKTGFVLSSILLLHVITALTLKKKYIPIAHIVEEKFSASLLIKTEIKVDYLL